MMSVHGGCSSTGGALGCGLRGRGFKSHHSPHLRNRNKGAFNAPFFCLLSMEYPAVYCREMIGLGTIPLQMPHPSVGLKEALSDNPTFYHLPGVFVNTPGRLIVEGKRKSIDFGRRSSAFEFSLDFLGEIVTFQKLHWGIVQRQDDGFWPR